MSSELDISIIEKCCTKLRDAIGYAEAIEDCSDYSDALAMLRETALQHIEREAVTDEAVQKAIDVIETDVQECTSMLQTCIDQQKPFIENEIAIDKTILTALRQYKPQHGWISVKDRLPEKGLVLLAYRKRFNEHGKGVCIGNMCSDGRFDCDWNCGNFHEYVTHWMPLPQPPKGE